MKFRTAAVILLLLFQAAARAQTEIEVPLFRGGAGTEFFLRCAREYEKLKPDVKIDLYLDPRIVDKVQVRILEGSFFELTNAGINYWPLIRNGDLLPLNKWLDGPSWDGKSTWRDTFLPGSLNGYVNDGKVYGVPLGYYASVIWYNKAIFRQHGWQPPKTWDELFALCKQIKEAGIPPMAFQGRYPYYAIPFYDHANYHLVGADASRARQFLAPGSISAPESVQAITLTRNLFQNYLQDGAMGMSHTESQLQFFLGKTAMIPCGAWLKSEMKGKIPDGFELGCFNLPVTANNKEDPSTVRVGIEPFVIMSHSKHPEIAVDFLRFMTSREMASLFARLQDIPTSIKGANVGNLSKDLDDLVKIVDGAKSSYGAVPGESYPEMLQIYNDMMYEAIADPKHLSPEKIAQSFETIGQAVRAKRLNPDVVKINHIWQPIAFLSALGLGAIYCIWRVGTTVAKRSGKTVSTSMRRLSFRNIILFVAPAILIYTIFVIVPSARAFSWSMHEWNGLTNMQHMPFKGFLNFKRILFESDDFWIALKNNLFIMFMVPVFVVPLALFLAAAISRGVWGATIFRIAFFFPNLVGGVAATLLWLHMYNPQGGLVNSALVLVGKALTAIGLASIGGWFLSWSSFAWLEPKHLYWALIPISVWGTVGFNMVLYLAAMQSVPESFYEAAMIDGATRWRQFWTITLPLIWDVLAISIVFLVIGGMKAFDVIWLLTNQQPSTENHVIATRMVQTMFKEFRVGEAAALAVMLFLMVFIGSAITMRGLRRETVEM